MKKKVMSAALSTAIVLGSLGTGGIVGAAPPTTPAFSDIQNSFAKDAIQQLIDLGIITGIDATHFDPKGQLTRAQFVTLMVKSLALPVDTSKTVSGTFEDVTGWAAPYVDAAFKAGIIKGLSADTFGPGANLTREQAAVIMVKSLMLTGEIDESEVAKLTFTDADAISDWAKQYVAIALKHGLIQGNPDGTFNPQGEATREQAAVMGANFLKSAEEVKNTQGDDKDEQPPVVVPPVVIPPVNNDGGGGSPVVVPIAVSNVHITSNNVKNSVFAKVGDTVTLTFETPEQVWKLSNFKINGSNPTTFESVEGEGGVWVNTATYVIEDSDPGSDALHPLTVNFQINVKNAAGIYSQTIESTTDGGFVAVLKQPIISDIHIQSSNVDPTVATVGDTVTLTFISNQMLWKLGNFKINGSNPTTFTSVEDGAVHNTATYVIEESDPLGVMKFQINAQNAAGVYTQTIETTTDGSAVTVKTVDKLDLSALIAVLTSIGSVADAAIGTDGSYFYPDQTWVTFEQHDAINQALSDGWDAVVNATTQEEVDNALASAQAAEATFRAAIKYGTKTPAPAPVAVSAVHIESNNSNSAYAKVGDTITLSFTTTIDVFKLVDFKFNDSNPDQYISIGGDGTWTNTATYTIHDSDQEGVMYFQIKIYVQDATGIYWQTIDATSDSSSVTVQKDH